MRIVDHTPAVRDLVMAAKAALDRVVPQFADSLPGPSGYVEAAGPELLRLVSELYQLRRFARLGAPHIDDAGGFGTGLDASDAPTIMSVVDGKESWDFQPWLAEKVLSAEQLLAQVLDICLIPTSAIGRHPRWRRVYRRDDPGADCRRYLEGIGTYLDMILGLFDSGELQVRQLVAADDDDATEEGQADE